SVNDGVRGFDLNRQGNRLTISLAPGVNVILRTWHEMDIVKLNQLAIVDQIVAVVSDEKLGNTYQKNLELDGSAVNTATIRKKILERLSRWQDLRSWDDQTARPSDEESKIVNPFSYWMINPFQEIELLHAVAQPLRSAELSESSKNIRENLKVMQVPRHMSGLESPFKIVRRPREVSATFKGHIRLDRTSTRSVDAHATWTDNASRATLNRKSGLYEVKTESRKGLLFSLRELVKVAIDDSGASPPTPLQPELDAKQNLQKLEDSIPVSDARPEATKPVTSPYDFGDTRARVIDIELLTHARHANEFASADPSIHTIKSPQKRVVVPGTAQPQPPKVEYVMPLYQWMVGSIGGEGVRRTREAGWFRIWLGDEWYSSGNGELLALVCWPGDLLDPAERSFLLSRTRKMKYLFEDPNKLPAVEPFITRWGLDPLLFETGEFWNMPASALKNRLRDLTQLSQSALLDDNALKVDLHHLSDVPTFEPQFNLGWLAPEPEECDEKKVVLALYRPVSDPISGRWYADIQIDPLHAYQPFVRLALARYQAHALQDNVDEDKAKHYSLRLSNIVPTDFIQLLPERSATLIPRWKSSDVMKTFDIVVAGTTLREDNTKGMSRSEFSVRVEEQKVGLIPQESEGQINGGWVPVRIHLDNDLQAYHKELEYMLRDGVWRATVAFKHQTSRIYSLAIEEYEVMATHEKNIVKRLVYFDRIPIRVDRS
ncbi:MAG: hypothetical protein Q7T74_03075, partial [Candidatus Saccharibacteria bacterium]|nr:hypothetical protein [Candidatus Saccharibacteria bacterium]